MKASILSYLKQHSIVILAVFIAIIIFIVVFSLYDLPLEAVLYAAVLTLFVFLVLGGLRFAAFYKKHRILTELQRKITTEIATLPHPASIIENDYHKLISILFEAKNTAALSSDRARSEMIDYYTLWAHQIKTPIAAISLLLQTSQNENEAALKEELFKIEQYVNMVLGYLRLDSDSSDYLIKEYPLDEIIRQSLRKYASSFIIKKLSVDFCPTNIRVLTDEKWLSFVIEQLFTNALKYTNEGIISIYADGNQLIIADTGIGIEAADLPRVFEKGFTGYNGREDKKSTGIGLYLCHRILKKLGHDIKIGSVLGEGTKVTIIFDKL